MTDDDPDGDTYYRYAEQYDPESRRMVGNFPQAFSHVALINTAHNLGRSTKPVEQRASRHQESA